MLTFYPITDGLLDVLQLSRDVDKSNSIKKVELMDQSPIRFYERKRKKNCVCHLSERHFGRPKVPSQLSHAHARPLVANLLIPTQLPDTHHCSNSPIHQPATMFDAGLPNVYSRRRLSVRNLAARLQKTASTLALCYSV